MHATTDRLFPPCPHCGPHVSHLGGACPRVRSLECWPDGTLKRIEYWHPAAPAATEGRAIRS